MADGEPDVKDIDRVEIEPTSDNELVDGGDTQPESSPAPEGTAEEGSDPETDDETSPDGKPEALVTHTPATTAAALPAEEPAADTKDGLVRQPDETPREFALRMELTRLRRGQRQDRAAELAPPTPAKAHSRELTAEEQQVLGKYKPEELSALREVLPVIAKDLGFVRADELEGANYQATAQAELDSFLDAHPEYLPEKDPDGLLWGALKTEFGIYKPPQNPKEYRKLLERSHQTVFGIKPSGSLPNTKAAEKKIAVASHGGTAGPGPAAAGTNRRSAPAAAQGYRFDMLKGFSDEERAALMDKAGD